MLRGILRRRPEPSPSQVLPIAECGSDVDLLVGDDDEPVWPVRNPEEREALAALAGVFDAQLECVAVTPPRAPRSTVGLVVGLGDVEREAALHAHLTGRAHRLVGGAAELADSPLPEVVVMVGPRLDPDLARVLLTSPPRAEATGVVWGRTRSELRRCVLVSAAAAALDGAPRLTRVDLLGAVAVSRVARDGREQLGSGASVADVRRVVSRGVGLLNVLGHGDGSGFRLSEHVVVCGCEGAGDDVDPVLAPACLERGECQKLSMPLAEARRSGRLLAPEALAARVLVLTACQAAFIGSHALDAAWSPFPRIQANPHIGAVLAPCDLSTTAIGLLAAGLWEPLAAGVPAGRALAGYTRSAGVAAVGHRMLLFGDPRTVAAPPAPARAEDAAAGGDDGGSPPAQAAPAPRAAPERRLVRRELPTVEAELELLATVSEYLRDPADRKGELTSARAHAALERWRDEVAGGTSSANAAQAFRLAVLDHLTSLRGNPEEVWMLLAIRTVRLPERSPCPHCAWPLQPFRVTLDNGLERRLAHCPRCANVSDQPLGAPDLRVRVSPPRVELEGSPPRADWAGAVYLVPVRSDETVAAPWPATSSGAAASSADLGATAWPAGPLSVRVVLIVGTAITAPGSPARAPAT